jgi:hypothetical protein
MGTALPAGADVINVRWNPLYEDVNERLVPESLDADFRKRCVNAHSRILHQAARSGNWRIGESSGGEVGAPCATIPQIPRMLRKSGGDRGNVNRRGPRGA